MHLDHCVPFAASTMLAFGGFDGQVLSNIVKIQFCELIQHLEKASRDYIWVFLFEIEPDSENFLIC